MEMVEDEDTFVIVLIGLSALIRLYTTDNQSYHTIDEVESLTAARAGAVSGTEPSDALRASNFFVASQFPY